MRTLEDEISDQNQWERSLEQGKNKAEVKLDAQQKIFEDRKQELIKAQALLDAENNPGMSKALKCLFREHTILN